VRELLATPQDKRTAAQEAVIFDYWRTTVPEWKDANEAIEKLWATHPEGTSQLVLKARETPRTTHVLKRGDFLRPGATATPGVPASLHPLPSGVKPDRLAFARGPAVADDGAGGGEPNLAGLFRYGAGAEQRGSGDAE
jgi:hypothetical protein